MLVLPDGRVCVASHHQFGRATCALRSTQVVLRIDGQEAGSLLRPVTGQHSVRLKLTAVAARNGLTWLRNGKVAGQSDNASAPL